MIDRFIDFVRKIAFKIFKPDTFLGKICDKLLTKEMFLYVVFGVLTTVVNFVAYWILQRVFAAANWQGVLANAFADSKSQKIIALLGKDTRYLDSTVLAWAISVIFAYFTNKLFVFESKSFSPKVVVREFVEFVGARIFSLAVELAGMFLFVSVLGLHDMLAKVIMAVAVIIINYVLSKLIIFKKEKTDNERN